MRRNFLFTAISVGSRLLVGLLLFLLLARLWGPAQFGVFSFAFSAMTLLVLVVDFGFDLYLMREVAAHPEDAGRLVGDTFRAKLLLSAVAAVAALCVIGLSGPELLPAGVALPLFVAPLRALGHYDLETSVVTTGNALQFGLAGGVAWVGGTVTAVAVAILVSRVGYLLIAHLALVRIVPHLRLSFTARPMPWIAIRRAWPYGVDAALFAVWNQLDVIVVRAVFGTQAVGIYSAGQKVILGFSALAPVIGNVMLPHLSRIYAMGNGKFWRLAGLTSVVFGIFGLILSLPLIFFAEGMVPWLLGAKYAELVEYLPYFALLLFVKYLGASAGVIATAIGMQKNRVVAQLVGLAVLSLLTLIQFRDWADVRGFVSALALSSASVGAVVGFSVIRRFIAAASGAKNAG
jgi:O-antigen/teichoic acid export membrane protein